MRLMSSIGSALDSVTDSTDSVTVSCCVGEPLHLGRITAK
jgi:hypothetical protein